MLVILTEKFKYWLLVCTTNMKEEILGNLKSLSGSAKLVYESGDFTSATVLYFKALFCVLDYVILDHKGFIPKSHTERFRILETDFIEYYNMLDKYFPIYQQTYSTKISKTVCDEIIKNVKKIIEKNRIHQ